MFCITLYYVVNTWKTLATFVYCVLLFISRDAVGCILFMLNLDGCVLRPGLTCFRIAGNVEGHRKNQDISKRYLSE